MYTWSEELKREVHPTLNKGFDVLKLSARSSRNVWWLGEQCQHTWSSTPSNRHKLGTGCPYCAGKKILPGFNDFQSLNPQIIDKLHPTKNSLDLTVLSSSSKVVIWWLETACGHEYQLSITQQIKGKFCKVCINWIIIPGINDLATIRPDIAIEWHPTKNELLPTQVSVGKPLKVWWLCKNGHEWLSTINDRCQDTSGCPVCLNRVVLAGWNDLGTTHLSVASEWHPTKNGELTPQMVTAGSDKSVWWLCSFGHEWQTPVYSRTSKTPTACSICSGKTVWAGVSDLKTKMPELAKEWHPTKNGNLKPSEVAYRSNLLVWWLCTNDHEWKTSVSNRSAGRGCRKCTAGKHSSKDERELIEYVESFGIPLVLHDRKILKGKEIDIYVPSQKLAIEFNGVYWHREASKGKDFHFDKFNDLRGLGITLIQVGEYDWRDHKDAVKRIIREHLHVDEPLDASRLSPATISPSLAAGFLERNHLAGWVKGTAYLGLFDDSELVAVAVMQRSTGSPSATVQAYCSAVAVPAGLERLVTFYASQEVISEVTVHTDNCYPEELRGFTVVEELEPDYRIVYKHNVYREGEIDVTGRSFRIWDAGSIHYNWKSK